MICPDCNGARHAIVRGRLIPCSTCAGCGIASCCDGAIFGLVVLTLVGLMQPDGWREALPSLVALWVAGWLISWPFRRAEL